MEIGYLGLDGNPGSGNGYGSVSQDGEASRQKWVRRCEGFKQEGSVLCGDVWRTPKVAKPDADLSPAASTARLLDDSCGLAVASDADKLSVSCNSKPESSALAYFHHMPAAHTKNAGYYYSGGMNASTGMYLLSGVRGPFTPSQWLELEQQALIYKYMKENEPVPLHLLIPIVKAFESAGWFGFNGGTCRPTSWGMGPFHLGYSNSTDPEPGRCRRTDGKKWRCARDAVANQKYCERHMNRGRHRSRKHVEGQGNGNGHSVSGATKPSTTKLIPPSVAASSADQMVLPGNCPSNSFDINQHHHQHYQAKSLQPLAPNPNTNAFVDRMQGSDESTLNGTGVPSQSPFDVVSWKTYGSSAYNPADFLPSNSSREFEMGLGVGFRHEQANWTSISYGPLGEALQCSSSTISNSTGESRKTSALNMFPHRWEYGIGSCQLSSLSPTGVLQSGHVSLSNSSAGSSPRADKSKAIDHSCSLQGLNLG